VPRSRSRWGLACATLALLAGCALAGYAAAAVADRARAGRLIHITARRFVFEPSEITLKKGEPVTLEFRAQDVLMGFNAPNLAARADLPPGQVVRVRLTPPASGTFPFLCDVFCGAGHENMNGVIKVVD